MLISRILDIYKLCCRFHRIWNPLSIDLLNKVANFCILTQRYYPINTRLHLTLQSLVPRGKSLFVAQLMLLEELCKNWLLVTLLVVSPHQISETAQCVYNWTYVRQLWVGGIKNLRQEGYKTFWVRKKSLK